MDDKIAKGRLAAGDEAWAEAAFRTGDFAGAREHFEAARESAAAHGDRKTEADAGNALGMLLHSQSITKLMAGQDADPADVRAEEEIFRRALAVHRELGDAVGTAKSLFGIGLVYQVLHRDWDSAMPYYRQALEFADALEEGGELYGSSEIHRHMGFYHLFKDVQPAEAVRHLRRSLDLRERLADPRRIPSGLVALGQAEAAAGNRDRAIELLADAVERARAAGLLPARIEDAQRALDKLRTEA